MIEIDVHRRLQGTTGSFDLHFHTKIEDGEFVTVYGPSGAGKTSALRMMAGLLTPEGGSMVVDGVTWFDKNKKVSIPPQQRNVGIVFQDYALFPNMTVRGNLEFALQKEQPKSIVDDLLELTELGQLRDKKPTLLSGGQKQRVALARALVRRPKLLLLDEPLSALDSEMQARFQDYILKIHCEFKLTTVLISHDLLEVIKMSRRVLVLEDGHIKKDGTPAEVLPLANLRSILDARF